MVLKGKVVSELVIRSPAVKFFSVFAKQLHNLQDIVDKVHDGKLHEGDWHDIGSVMSWGLTTGIYTSVINSVLRNKKVVQLFLLINFDIPKIS